MKPTRRKVVAALGVGGISLGAVFGTGAFSSVEAERDVTIELGDDATALLALEPNDASGLAGITGVSAVDGGPLDAYGGDTTQYLDDSGPTLALDISNANISQATGANNDAVTSFRDLVRVHNNGTQDVGVNIENAPAGLDILAYSTTPGATVSLVDNNFPVTLPQGTTAGATIVVDSTEFSTDISETVTIVADASQ